MYVLEESIDIDASPADVWAVLSDLPAWRDWQGFIKHESGEATVGASLDVTLEPPGGRKVRFTPVVTVATPDRELTWHTRMMAGLFDARHSFLIQTDDSGRTRFVQREEFRGGFTWLLRAMGELTKGAAGFRYFNTGLKARVESAQPT